VKTRAATGPMSVRATSRPMISATSTTASAKLVLVEAPVAVGPQSVPTLVGSWLAKKSPIAPPSNNGATTQNAFQKRPPSSNRKIFV